MNLLSEGYAVETDQGMEWVRPLDSLMSIARIVAPENYTECPKCHIRTALFYGDPDGEYWCVFCQLLFELAKLEGGC